MWRYPVLNMQCLWYHIAMTLIIKGGIWTLVGGLAAVRAEFPWVPDDDDEEKSDFYKKYPFEDAPPVINALPENTDDNQHLILKGSSYDVKINNADDADAMDVKDAPPVINALPENTDDNQHLTLKGSSYDVKINNADDADAMDVRDAPPVINALPENTDDNQHLTLKGSSYDVKINNADDADAMDVKEAVYEILAGRSGNNYGLGRPEVPEVDFDKWQHVATAGFISSISEDVTPVAEDVKKESYEIPSSSYKYSGDHYTEDPLLIINALPDVEADHQQLTWNHPIDDRSNNADDRMDIKGALKALLAGRNINNWPDNPQVDFEKTQYVATASFVSSDSEVITPVATDKINNNYNFMTSEVNENDDRNSKVSAIMIFLKTIQNNQDRKHSTRFRDEKNVSELIRMKKQYYFELDPTRTKEPDVDKDAVKPTLSPEFDSSELNVSRTFKEDMHTVMLEDDITTTVTTDDGDNYSQSDDTKAKEKEIQRALHQILSGRETKGSTPVYKSEEDTTTTRITNAAEDKDTILKKVAENSLQTTKILRQGPDFSASLASRDVELASALSQLGFMASQFSSLAGDIGPDFSPFINLFLPPTFPTLRTTKGTPPRLDIPQLLYIISNLTADYETNLTNWVNETLQKWSIPTCPTPTTTSTTTTTVTTPPHLDYETNGTGYLVAKCYVCGLEAEGIPRRASCADAFAGDFMPLMPVDPKARGQIGLFKKYCRYMDISHYHLNASDPRSMWGRWTGGCSVRWTDIASVYTQRTCRNRHRATLGRHFASKRMAKLEMALQNIDDGCIGSPAASLLVVSRGISIYAKFHACVCSGPWCNRGVFGPQWKWYLALLPLFAFLVCW